MAKFICNSRVCILKEQNGLLPEGTIAIHQQISTIYELLPKGTIAIYQHNSTICELACCTTLVYTPWWLTSLASRMAPSNDLYLYNLLNQYAEINALVSRSAHYAFSKHPQYLTSE